LVSDRGFRIVSFDGGGIRGLLTAVLLKALADDPALEGWTDRVDLFCGTSTGGIIALALAHGRPPSSLVDLYGTDGPSIFGDRLPAAPPGRELIAALEHLPDIGTYVVDVRALFRCKYDNAALRAGLISLFGAATLADLRPVGVATVQLDDGTGCWRPRMLHNYRSADTSRDLAAVDTALRSAAAPTYFPSHQGYIDGGVFANNPSVAALAMALDAELGGQRLEGIRLLSLGTGLVPQSIDARTDLDWGEARWAKPLLSLLVGGVQSADDYHCRQILGARYNRLDVVLDRDVALDDVRAVAYLKAAAAEAVRGSDFAQCREWIRRELLD
jgi:uncharacterized protein